MCDFSLEVYGSRPAREGEKYVTSRFPSGAVGLAAFGETSVPVCVQCDTQLMLEAIPMDLQISLGVSSREAVTFVRLERDRKSTRLNSSHVEISYAVFCLKKKNK